MSYLKHKPGSIEELMANEASKLNDNAYQDMFKKELDKAGKGIGGMSPKEKKDFFNKIDSKYKAKNEEVQESASQVQVKRDGKGNFNLMLRGKEIGYYHKSGSKYMVYYDKDGDDYDQSDEVSSEMQAKKLAYDNMNEARFEVEGRVDYKGVSGGDDFSIVVDASNEKAAEDKVSDMLFKHRDQKKIGPRGGRGVDDYEIESVTRTSKSVTNKFSTYHAAEYKVEAKVDELTKAQEKLPPALQKAIKDKETKKEGFASDAQRKAAFASGYKEKDKKEETVKKEGGPGSGPQGGDSYKTGHKKSVMKPGAGKRPGSAKDGGQTDKEADDYDNEMGEALGKEDDSIVKAVVSQLKKATKAHDGQAKDLEKAMKTEADQHGDEINKDKVKASMTKGEKKPQKLHADSGSKLTKVETEPKVDYKN
jgi:hypothetical protein